MQNDRTTIGIVAAAVVVVVLLGLGLYVSQNQVEVVAGSNDITETTTEAPTTEAPAAVAAPAATSDAEAPEVPARLVCGEPRIITVTDGPVWKIVRESETATTKCTRVTVYRDTEQISTIELPVGIFAIDEDQGLWTYRDGGAANAADQTVANVDLGKQWLIARTTDNHSVSANLADGQLKVSN